MTLRDARYAGQLQPLRVGGQVLNRLGPIFKTDVPLE